MYIMLSVCLSVRPSVRLFVCLFVSVFMFHVEFYSCLCSCKSHACSRQTSRSNVNRNARGQCANRAAFSWRIALQVTFVTASVAAMISSAWTQVVVAGACCRVVFASFFDQLQANESPPKKGRFWEGSGRFWDGLRKARVAEGPRRFRGGCGTVCCIWKIRGTRPEQLRCRNICMGELGDLQLGNFGLCGKGLVFASC